MQWTPWAFPWFTACVTVPLYGYTHRQTQHLACVDWITAICSKCGKSVNLIMVGGVCVCCQWSRAALHIYKLQSLKWGCCPCIHWHHASIRGLLPWMWLPTHFSGKCSFLILHPVCLVPSRCRSTGLTCPAPTVPSYPPSMQSQPARTCSGWCSPPSSPPCPTLTPAPTRTAITWPTGRGCWGTTRWLGPGSSAPSGTPEAGVSGTNRWETWDDKNIFWECNFMWISFL